MPNVEYLFGIWMNLYFNVNRYTSIKERKEKNSVEIKYNKNYIWIQCIFFLRLQSIFGLLRIHNSNLRDREREKKHFTHNLFIYMVSHSLFIPLFALSFLPFLSHYICYALCHHFCQLLYSVHRLNAAKNRHLHGIYCCYVLILNGRAGGCVEKNSLFEWNQWKNI